MQITRYGSLLLLLLAACSTNVQLPLPAKDQQPALPPEVARLKDTLISPRTNITDAAPLARSIDSLLLKYTYGRDSLAHAALLVLRTSVTGDPDSVMTYVNSAGGYFDQHNVHPELGVVVNMRAAMSTLAKGKQAAANYYANKAGAMMGVLPVDSFFSAYRLSRYYHDIAAINWFVKNYELAEKYMRQAIRYVDKLPPQRLQWRWSVYQDAFAVWLEQEKIDSARYLWEAANRLSNEIEQNQEVVITTLDHNAAYYYATRQWDSSLYYCRQELALMEKDTATPPYKLGIVYYNTADVLTWLGRLPEAYNYLQRSRGILAGDSATLQDDWQNLHENLLHYYMMAGPRSMAQKQWTIYQQHSRSFYNKERLRVMDELEAQYQLKDKERRIQLLDTEKKAVADTLRNRNQLLLISILVTLLAATLVVLLTVILRQRRISATMEKVALEQRLLRSQMEPHFIFNTLSALQHIIRNGQQERAIGYLQHFAGLLRLSLENSRASLVSLADEVRALEHYLDLQQLRFEGKFSYQLFVYDGYQEDELLIPPMLLQPFVENAIEHGLRSISSGGWIKITILKGTSTLECTIEDNGHGLPGAVARPAGKRSLSTQITRERLEILSRETGRPASLEIMDRSTGNGACVRLVIPFQ